MSSASNNLQEAATLGDSITAFTGRDSLRKSTTKESLSSCNTDTLTNELNNSDITSMAADESRTQQQEHCPQPSAPSSSPCLPNIVLFESPIHRRNDSMSSSSAPYCCTTDVDFDTDLSGDSVDIDSHSHSNSSISFGAESPQQESCSSSSICPPFVVGEEENALSLSRDVEPISAPSCDLQQAAIAQNVVNTSALADFTKAPPPDESNVSTGVKVKPRSVVRKGCNFSSFTRFRMQYLFVHTAIMLADGLQGTHLYVLYEGYGYSVASLYAIGFVSGAFTSPFIGPAVDKIGRKRAAIIYCVLEMIINYFEQYPIFLGLILSRVLGGITTNLLFTVFESWLITEHRKRGFEEDKLEIILRDSTIVSNSAAIISGYLAHCLADVFGPVGPFEGAVAFTGLALLIVGILWTENFGRDQKSTSSELLTFKGNMVNAYRTIIRSSNISRIGVIQGLTEGSLQTFVFLWAPALRSFAASATEGAWGLGKDEEPAYGLIFGSFMAFGVLGGFLEPTVRKSLNSILPFSERSIHKEGEVDPVSVHSLCVLCYAVSALVLLTPCVLSEDSSNSFILCFASFLVYELMIGLYMPCEGVVRSIYMPNESICSLMTMLRVIVNVAVAAGVISTNFIPFTFAFGVLSLMMVSSAFLQLTLLLEHKDTTSEEKKTK